MTKIKKTWSSVSSPPYSLVTMCLIRHRDKCTFICYALFNVFERRHFWHKRQLIRGDSQQNVNSVLFNDCSRMGREKRSTKRRL